MAISIDVSHYRVLVVGGTSGINLSIALAFGAEGAQVGVISRSVDKVNAATALLISAGAGRALGQAADVRHSDAITTAIDAIATEFGGLDVVISGAAGNFPALATGMSSNGFRSVLDIDLLGAFHVMKAIYPWLTKPGASVINISAPQAQVAMSGQSHVCAAKAGVDMLTKTLSMEWGSEGIRVNSIIPGPIEGTEGMARLAPTPAMMDTVRKSVPLGRLGRGDDIANACLFLASPYAAYISGAIIPVDGGWINGGVSVVGESLRHMLTTT